MSVLQFNKGSHIAVSKNFMASEFDCSCQKCGITWISIKTVNVLQMLRDTILEPIHINSGFRCPEHNKEVGGAPQSQHMLGLAADVSAKNHRPQELFDLTENLLKIHYKDTGGLRLYQSWIHIDTRPGRHRWKFTDELPTEKV